MYRQSVSASQDLHRITLTSQKALSETSKAYFHDRSGVPLPSVGKPEDHTEDQGRAINKHTIVHFLNRRVHYGGEEGKDKPDERECHCQNRDGNAETSHSKPSVGDLRSGRGETLVQHNSSCEEEGRIVAGDYERDERIEANGRANVDE